MKTLQVRLKDKHSEVLEQMAREVNFTWNFINAAKNILACGHARLAGGIPALNGGEDVK